MAVPECLRSTDVETILGTLRGRPSERKLRLFAVACCRRLLDQIPVFAEDKKGVDVAERFADCEASAEELEETEGHTYTEWTTYVVQPKCDVEIASESAYEAMISAPARDAYPAEADPGVRAFFSAGQAHERQAQVQLLRCIFGHLFRDVRVEPAWLLWGDCTAVKLAQGIYDERAFDRLPILADALEESGCHDTNILDHCRQPGAHARGCFVVDLILGRS